MDHEDLVKRLLDARKSFKAEGVAYRDAPIWCILDLARSSTPIAFVSNNWHGFGDSKEGKGSTRIYSRIYRPQGSQVISWNSSRTWIVRPGTG